ncbi:hypothetical protein BDP27DRAFT_1425093 [Rhodocollybia butyracea]|uniref:BON domain-containing protein n=1 Tax=Rhodocollybia butyracea TaxID=206335 RepID=A0A9P5PKU3_9AGAR|nr:hypothetical protein BDP27DRAFT_1425093 [Rhodocollybia butyracea]
MRASVFLSILSLVFVSVQAAPILEGLSGIEPSIDTNFTVILQNSVAQSLLMRTLRGDVLRLNGTVNADDEEVKQVFRILESLRNAHCLQDPNQGSNRPPEPPLEPLRVN